MIGYRTVLQGQRAAIWNKRGQMKLIDGPQRVLLLRERMQPLERHVAGPEQYLAVSYKDGRKVHLRGPVAVWRDPVEHDEIKLHPAIPIDANEAVVVYRQLPDRVDRRVVRGPDLFMPAANEWLHEFSWHGADPRNPQRKLPHALRFTRLRVIPDQMYFDVEDVRTADDALLVIKLMIFFELKEIERMLDQTHDPIGDFINAVSADVIDFAATLSFEKFKAETERLNDLATYPQLVQRAQRIGYHINKVVYRGYHASAKLQAMHDNAIEARTKLRLEAETETQAQELADLKLRREAQRAAERQTMEEEELNHQNRLKQLTHDQQMRQQQSERTARLEAKRLTNELQLKHRQALNREQATFLQAIQAMQVDLTRYLVAQYQNPDRLIRIDGDRRAQLHLHEGDRS